MRFDLEARDLIWNWFEFITIWFVIICDFNKSQLSVIPAEPGWRWQFDNVEQWLHARRSCWATVCKTARPICYRSRCLSCLSVVSVTFVYCVNGWTDQDETWLAGRPRPWPHCVRWGPSSPSPKGHSPHPIFGPYLLRPNGCMDQDATWYGARPQPRGHCVEMGPSPPKFSAVFIIVIVISFLIAQCTVVWFVQVQVQVQVLVFYAFYF